MFFKVPIAPTEASKEGFWGSLRGSLERAVDPGWPKCMHHARGTPVGGDTGDPGTGGYGGPRDVGPRGIPGRGGTGGPGMGGTEARDGTLVTGLTPIRWPLL